MPFRGRLYQLGPHVVRDLVSIPYQVGPIDPVRPHLVPPPAVRRPCLPLRTPGLCVYRYTLGEAPLRGLACSGISI